MTHTLKQQVAFLRQLIKERQTAWPIRVEMGRMTKKEMETGIAIAKSTLETLEKAEAAGGVAESAMKEMAPAVEETMLKALDLGTIVHEIHRCAKDHAEVCEHCRAIANILDESGSVV